MQRKPIDFSKCTVCILLAMASLCLYFVGENGEPLPLALAYGMASAGISPLLSAAVGFYPSLLSGDPLSILLSLAQVGLLWLGFFLQDRLRRADFRKSPLFPMFFFGDGVVFIRRVRPLFPVRNPLFVCKKRQRK